MFSKVLMLFTQYKLLKLFNIFHKKFDFDNIASTIIPVRYVLRAVIHTTYHHIYAFILSCIFVDLTIT